MKRFTLLIFGIGLLFTFRHSIGHCTVINDLEAKRSNGGATSVTYEYDVGLVYNGLRYLIRHSENGCISKLYGGNHIDFAPEEGAIYSYDGNDGIGIFLNKFADNKTKVDYVYTDGFLNSNLKCSTEAIIEELPFLLKNKKTKAYLEYTHKLCQEWEEKNKK